MGTAAMIGIYNEDGTVTASYCHYDGYLEGVGATLLKSYNSQYDASYVSHGGYVSSLDDDYLVSRQMAVHNEPAISYTNVSTYLERGSAYSGAEYLYLWDGDCWYFAPTNTGVPVGFEEVKINLKQNENNG